MQATRDLQRNSVKSDRLQALRLESELPIALASENRDTPYQSLKRMAGMLKSIGKPSLLLKWRKRYWICMRSERLDDGLRSRIRPLTFGGYVFWFEKADAT